MKIVSITTVKNESDIIESFIRYHLNIFDFMIVLDNGSTDDTSVILNKLMEENLPLNVIKDADRYFEPKEKYNFLLNIAIDKFEADIIVPLDADEFLTSDYTNPRTILDNFNFNNTYLKIRWRTYIPTKNDEDTNFIPSKITHVRQDDLDRHYKVIVSKQLINEFDGKLIIGNHDISFNNTIDCEIRTDLRLAHFPIRSYEQTMSKVLVNYPNTKSRRIVNENNSVHYSAMFYKIKNNQNLDFEDIIQFAMQYALRENANKKNLEHKDINITNHPMNLSFCKDLDIKYEFKINYLSNLLENYLYFADEIHKYKNLLL